MPEAAILKVLAGTSTVLGLLATVAYLFFLLQVRQDRSSVKNAIEGEGLFNAQQIVKLLAQFTDDTARLEALRALAGHDERKAARILAKIKSNVDIARLRRLSIGYRLRLLGISAAFLLLIALLSLAATRRTSGVTQHAPELRGTPAQRQEPVTPPSRAPSVTPQLPTSPGRPAIASPQDILRIAGLEPGSRPFITSMGAVTLRSRADILYLSDWRAFGDDPTPFVQPSALTADTPTLVTVNDIQDDAVYDKYRRTLLPGLLVFTLRNIAGRTGPDVVVHSLRMHVLLSELEFTLGPEDLIVILRQVPTFAEVVPPVRATLRFGPSEATLPIGIPQPYSPRLSLFRDRLPPGEESLYLIALEPQFHGSFLAAMDLEVAYDYVDADMTRHVTRHYRVLRSERLVSPDDDHVVQVFTTSTAGDSGLSMVAAHDPAAEAHRGVDFHSRERIDFKALRLQMAAQRNELDAVDH